MEEQIQKKEKQNDWGNVKVKLVNTSTISKRNFTSSKSEANSKGEFKVTNNFEKHRPADCSDTGRVEKKSLLVGKIVGKAT